MYMLLEGSTADKAGHRMCGRALGCCTFLSACFVVVCITMSSDLSLSQRASILHSRVAHRSANRAGMENLVGIMKGSFVKDIALPSRRFNPDHHYRQQLGQNRAPKINDIVRRGRNAQQSLYRPSVGFDQRTDQQSRSIVVRATGQANKPSLARQPLKPCAPMGPGKMAFCVYDEGIAWSGLKEVCVAVDEEWRKARGVEPVPSWCVGAWDFVRAVADPDKAAGLNLVCDATALNLRDLYRAHLDNPLLMKQKGDLWYKTQTALEKLDKECPA
eukprot:gnl/MRDRNA2_/MRDRNA2_58228_c0_seq1.p1 gnl/MRDRNA2_/MRDRNA2_58228_c0~~gnl/MRDRNA2_/MRDRNA2_58228_c0_seq1.p1  ORF type:complete len:273 (-),score=36.26 gnl/MRDRNA2_/MRDRNA2_58228_c0_seq1:188-1006(-)